MIEEDLDEDFSRLEIVDFSFHGTILDDRGQRSVDFIKQKSKSSIKLEYNVLDKNIIVDNRDIVIIDEFYDYFRDLYGGKSLLLETTTLGFPELLVLTKAARVSNIKEFFMVYWEPYNYKKHSENILHNRDFELSGEVIGYKAIPGFAPLLLGDTDYNTRSVFCLGFEAARLDRAFEENQMIDPDNCSLIFGIPAFTPGWEMNSFANNLRVIVERNLRCSYHYCAASNPLATYSYLKVIEQTLAENERLVVSPIGTKPAGVGVALFVTEFSEVGIMYDHPIKEVGRSKELGRRHIYEIDFND